MYYLYNNGMQQLDLQPDPRRPRFLEELAAHTEDACDASTIGNAHILAATFNFYVMQKRLHNAALLFGVAVITFLIPFLWILIAAGNIDTIDAWWQWFVIIQAYLLVLPIIIPLLIAVFFPGLTDLVFAYPEIITPAFTCIFWTAVAYVFIRRRNRILCTS